MTSDVIAKHDDLLFLPLFSSTMSGDSLKRRKIAVLGSRSVGKCRTLPKFSLGLKNQLNLCTGKSSLVKQFIEVRSLNFLALVSP